MKLNRKLVIYFFDMKSYQGSYQGISRKLMTPLMQPTRIGKLI